MSEPTVLTFILYQIISSAITGFGLALGALPVYLFAKAIKS